MCHATIYCQPRYGMNCKYEYTTDKIDNLIGNEGNKKRPQTAINVNRPKYLINQTSAQE